MHPLTDTWWRLLVNRTDGTLRARGHTWVFDRRRLTEYELSAALEGRAPLGVYAVNAVGTARWLCLDADTPQARDGLVAIASGFEEGTYLFEPSRRGAHLWRFCPPTSWSDVRTYGDDLVERSGISCEVFPKSAGRTGVRLPLTRHPKNGQRYPAVDPATGEIQSVEQLMALRPAPLPATVLERRIASFDSAHGNHGELQTDFEALYREIARVTRIRRYGRDRAIGHCPFHDDQHPSLSVVGGFWRCWAGCGEGGLNAFRARARERQLV